MSLINNFIHLFVESAPWLMLGLLIAGLMKAFLPQDFLARHLGQPGFGSTLKAALFGAPLPLCSCGVIPAAVALRRSGASKSATTSFLISTPETGVDSVSVSYALLGPFMAVIRPIAAVTSALVAGVLVGRDQEQTPRYSVAAPKGEDASCCAHATAKQDAHAACCATDSSSAVKPGFVSKVSTGLRFTLNDLVKDIAVWLLLGLAFAALIKTYVPDDFLLQWGGGLMAFIVMALVGVPMYICATASTPIAAGLLFSGVSPGAVLVFMLVGPATNIATVGLVKRELGSRALAAYLASVVGVGFIFGFAVNLLADYWQLDFAAQAQHAHNLVNPVVAYASSVLLAVLMAWAIMDKYRLLPIARQQA